MADDALANVPDVVKQFVVYFYRHIRERNQYEILSMYEGTFPKLSERYFKSASWPPVEMVASLVEGDHVFCLLYKELYYRHIFAKLTPTLEQRCEAWDNYCALFNVFLHGNVNMVLPNQWLWDMVDEFIYQFQSFCQYRSKLAMKSPEEIAMLKGCDQIWGALGVMNYLQALIDKSGIEALLKAEREKDEPLAAADLDLAGSNVLRMMGYYAMPGLLRVHCLLGDYTGALDAVDPINLHLNGLYTKVPGCYINTAYYVGFAYMMNKRYTDAVKHISSVLVYIGRTKGNLQRSIHYEQILKKNEQMYALLAICVVLCPQYRLLEEGVNNSLREKYAEKIHKMTRGDEAVFDELFSYGCPKFITPSCPNWQAETLVNFNQEAYRLQLKLFLAECRSQAVLLDIRSFLKLYTSISQPKLASLMEMDEAALRTALMSQKLHSVQKVWVPGCGGLNSGKQQPMGDVEFYLEGDMVHVSDTKATRRYGDFFVRHISKFEEIITDLAPRA